MKTSKELIERLQSDEAFVKEFDEALKSKRESGAKNVYECFIPVAADYGYAVSKEEMDAFAAERSEELSEEELGKLSGGTACVAASWGLLVATGLLSALTAASAIATALSDDDE